MQDFFFYYYFRSLLPQRAPCREFSALRRCIELFASRIRKEEEKKFIPAHFTRTLKKHSTRSYIFPRFFSRNVLKQSRRPRGKRPHDKATAEYGGRPPARGTEGRRNEYKRCLPDTRPCTKGMLLLLLCAASFPPGRSPPLGRNPNVETTTTQHGKVNGIARLRSRTFDDVVHVQ